MGRPRTTPRGAAEQAPPLVERLQRGLRGFSALLALIGGVAVVGAGTIYLWVPELRGFAAGTLVVGGALLALSLAVSFATVRAAVTGRRGRYTTVAVTSVVLFTAILVFITFIAVRNPLRWDTTASRQFTLAPQTLKVLEGLKEPVHITGFFVPTRPDHQVAQRMVDDLLYEFRHRSGGRLTYEYVDPEAHPSRARQFNLQKFPALVFEARESGRRYALQVPPVTEQDLTSALLIVTGAKQKKVYFLVGHGEKDIADLGENTRGFGFAARGVIADNYRVETLNLKEAGGVPEDAAVLVVAGPTRNLLPEEQEALSAWLRQGGRALFLLDPDTPDSFRRLLEPWGIAVGKGQIVDPSSSISGDPRTPLLQRNRYAPSTSITEGGAITQPLDVTFFPQVTSVDVRPDVKERIRKGEAVPATFIPLAVTSPNSWLTEDPDRNTFLPGEDQRGPFPIAMAVQAVVPVDEEPPANPQAVTSIVVFGDSDFVSNKYYAAYTNADFFLNAVDWLAQDYDLISIRPKVVAFRELVLTRREFDFIRYSSLFLLPAAVAVIGALVWWRRR